MDLLIFSVFDKAIGAYLRPFCMASSGQALRQFEDECADSETPIAKHPEDYSLFLVGEFDGSSGELVGKEPLCVARAHEVVARLQAGADRYGREIMPLRPVVEEKDIDDPMLKEDAI